MVQLPESRWTGSNSADFASRSDRLNSVLSPSGIQLPKNVQIAVMAVDWAHDADEFKQRERELVCAEPPAVPSEVHEQILVELIRRGQGIFVAWNNDPSVPKLLFSKRDFEATLATLAEVYCAYYSPKPNSIRIEDFNRIVGICES